MLPIIRVSTRAATRNITRAAPTTATFSTLSTVGTTASSSSSTFQTKRWTLFAAASAAAAIATYSSTSYLASCESSAGLTPKEFRAFKLIRVEKLNHNTSTFVFEVPSASEYPVSSFVLTKYTGADGKDVSRPYTPIDTDKKNELHFLIKDYPNGNMSSYIHKLKVGDLLEIKGPLPKLKYEHNAKHQVGLVSGGTGITPMLQVLEKALSNKEDKTTFSLVFANQTPEDILLKGKLDTLQQKYPGRFNVTYTVSKLTDAQKAAWKGEVGHVSKDMLAKYLPKASDKNNFVYVCGPPGFMKAVSGTKAPDYTQGELSGVLKDLGFSSEQVFKL